MTVIKNYNEEVDLKVLKDLEKEKQYNQQLNLFSTNDCKINSQRFICQFHKLDITHKHISKNKF